jgi:hypothetical protein
MNTLKAESANPTLWRKAVVEVWMLDLAGFRWLELAQTSS